MLLRWRLRTLLGLAGGNACFALAGARVLGWLPRVPGDGADPVRLVLGCAAFEPGSVAGF